MGFGQAAFENARVIFFLKSSGADNNFRQDQFKNKIKYDGVMAWQSRAHIVWHEL